MPQTKIVLVTSAIDRARALIFLVTVTPAILNVAIEKIPKVQKNNNAPSLNAAEKYSNGLSKNGNPWWLNTQASTPNRQGIKLMMGKIIKYPQRPKRPSYPTTCKGSKWYLFNSFC